MQRLQHQHLEFQNRVERRATTLVRVATAQGLDQNRPKLLKINRRRQPLQRITLRRPPRRRSSKSQKPPCPDMTNLATGCIPYHSRNRQFPELSTYHSRNRRFPEVSTLPLFKKVE